MFITLINDCRDANAFGRQTTRLASLFHHPVNPVGVMNDLEAAGNLIDCLDAAEGQEGIILVNVAPRHGAAKKWPNGTPFGYFYYEKTLVIASIDGLTLSLIKKLGITDHINVFDIPPVMHVAELAGVITKETAERVIATQFRSFEFLPRVAFWLWSGLALPSEPLLIEEVGDAPDAVWWVDNFGNCKTTIFPEEIATFLDETSLSGISSLMTFKRLKDVPDNEAAFVVGSSGLSNRRFIELVIQGGSAAKRFNLFSGKSLRKASLL